MHALYFIVKTLLGLALFVFLLRPLLQWVRADFRNPVSQAVVKITNPLVIPLRRVLPPVGKTDTASIVAVVLVAFVGSGLLLALQDTAVPDLFPWLQLTLLQIARTALWTYFYAILLYALLSLIAPGGAYSPVQAVLVSLCEPVLRPIRRLIPPIAGLDLSPLWAGIAIQAILILINY